MSILLSLMVTFTGVHKTEAHSGQYLKTSCACLNLNLPGFHTSSLSLSLWTVEKQGKMSNLISKHSIKSLCSIL